MSTEYEAESRQKQDEAHDKGAKACLGNLRLDENPYKPGTAEHLNWIQGWAKEQRRLFNFGNAPGPANRILGETR